jgi:hypothetical protein
MRHFIYSGNNSHTFLHIRIGRWISPAIWRWAVILAVFTCLSAGEGELTTNAQKAVDAGLRSSAQVRADYIKKIDAERQKVLTSLKKELDSLTKAGKLDEAVAVKNFMAGLTVESWESQVNATPTGQAAYVANPEKTVARVSVEGVSGKVANFEKGALKLAVGSSARMESVDFGDAPAAKRFVQSDNRADQNYTVRCLTSGTVYVMAPDLSNNANRLPTGVDWKPIKFAVGDWTQIQMRGVVRAGQVIKVTGFEMAVVADIVGGDRDEEAP